MRPRSPFRFAHVYLSAANSLSPMSTRFAEMPFCTPRPEPPGSLGHFLTHFPSPFRWLDSQVRAGRAFLRRQHHEEGLKMASVRLRRLLLFVFPSFCRSRFEVIAPPCCRASFGITLGLVSPPVGSTPPPTARGSPARCPSSFSDGCALNAVHHSFAGRPCARSTSSTQTVVGANRTYSSSCAR